MLAYRPEHAREEQKQSRESVMATVPAEGLQLRSLVKKSAELEVSLVKVAIPEPAADEIIVRVEATPINPSDLGLLLSAADIKTAKASGTKDMPVVTASIPDKLMAMLGPRVDQS